MRRISALIGAASLLLAGSVQAVPSAWTTYSSMKLNSVTFTSASSSPWTVPAGWQSTSSGALGFANKIECVGDGAKTSGGGGGGAYGGSTNVSLTPSASVAFSVAAKDTGGDSYFCNATTNCASIAGSAVVVGGKGTTTSTGAAAASSVGTVTSSGGNGSGSGSGGGAGGPNGAGNAGVGSAAGGSGDAGLGGAGGSNAIGQPGAEWDGSIGSGGGASGNFASGAYGAGAAGSGPNHHTGAGACLVRYYTPQ